MSTKESVKFLWRAVPHDFLNAENDAEVGCQGRRHDRQRREGCLAWDIVREIVRENVGRQDGEEKVGEGGHDGDGQVEKIERKQGNGVNWGSVT